MYKVVHIHLKTPMYAYLHIHTHINCIVHDHVSIFKILMSVQTKQIIVRRMLYVPTLKADIIVHVNQALLIFTEMVQIAQVCIQVLYLQH